MFISLVSFSSSLPFHALLLEKPNIVPPPFVAPVAKIQESFLQILEMMTMVRPYIPGLAGRPVCPVAPFPSGCVCVSQIQFGPAIDANLLWKSNLRDSSAGLRLSSSIRPVVHFGFLSVARFVIRIFNTPNVKSANGRSAAASGGPRPVHLHPAAAKGGGRGAVRLRRDVAGGASRPERRGRGGRLRLPQLGGPAGGWPELCCTATWGLLGGSAGQA